jgi:hypothetical protein
MTVDAPRHASLLPLSFRTSERNPRSGIWREGAEDSEEIPRRGRFAYATTAPFSSSSCRRIDRWQWDSSLQ